MHIFLKVSTFYNEILLLFQQLYKTDVQVYVGRGCNDNFYRVTLNSNIKIKFSKIILYSNSLSKLLTRDNTQRVNISQVT